MRNIKIEPYTICSSKLPESFDGCRLALLTDLHNNMYGSKNEYLLEKIEAEKPDYIMITGDMIVGGRECETEAVKAFLAQLADKWEIFYSLGNHEQKLQQFPETCDTVYVDYINFLKDKGVHVLDNETCQLKRDKQCIYVSGVSIDYYYYGKIWKRIKMKKEYLEEVLGKKKKDAYEILLAHNPAYFKTYASWGADLTLSGHVHGGIIILPYLGGVIAPSYRVFPKYDFGLFSEGEKRMVLSRGLGSHTIPLRIRNKPELSIITLKKQKEKPC